MISSAASQAILVMHPGDVIWEVFENPNRPSAAAAALRDLGATEEDAQEYTRALIADLANRDLLVPAGVTTSARLC